MRFAIFATLASLALADFQTVIDDTKSINTAITGLNNTINSYKAGDVGGGLALLGSSGKLSDALKQANKDVAASEPFGDNSQAVAVALVGLSNPTFSLLDNIVARKPDFDQPIFGFIKPSSIIKGQLTSNKQSVVDLGNNITAKLNAQFAALAPQAISLFEQHFDTAIAAYQNA